MPAPAIVVYASANMADNAATTNLGGAIDETTRVVFTDIDPAGSVEISSDNAGDTTQNVTVQGLQTNGVRAIETLPLNGATWVAYTKTIKLIEKVTVDAAHAGNITVREAGPGDTLMVIEPGVLQVRRPFLGAASDVAGGAGRVFYEKVFYKNTDVAVAVTNAVLSEGSDPGAIMAFALENTLDGNDTNGVGNNHEVAPGGYAFDSAAKSVGGDGNHLEGTAQGVWLALGLLAGTNPAETVYNLGESGQYA